MLAAVITSCSLIGINLKRKTPSIAGKYPKFTRADSLKGAYNQWRENNDVTYYQLELDIDPEEKYLKGKVLMRFTALEDLKKIQIDLYENMKINEISSSNSSLNYIREGNAIFITFDRSIPKTTEFELLVDYEGKPIKAKRPPWNGGFVWDKDSDKNPFVGVACELKGASLWWPLKDHLMDEPDSVDLIFSVPRDLYCVSNGQLRSEETTDDQARFHWHVSYPINNYNVTVYLGNYVHFHKDFQGIEDKFRMDFYVIPQNVEEAKEQFKQAPIALETYEKYFGPYPWPRDGYKLVQSPYAGMEHQSAIAYGAKFKDGGFGSYDYIIIHETAHEWWGNSVTARDFAEAWIHEGFATYSEALVEEMHQGPDAYKKYINLISLFIKNKRPVIGPKEVSFWDFHDNDLYMKGAMFLQTLRTVINDDELFFDILKTYYQEHAYGFATTEQFLKLVNEKTGEDFTAIFQQYLYNRACPELEYTIHTDSETGKTYLLTRWTNTIESFRMPVKVNNGARTFFIKPSLDLQGTEVNAGNLKINGENAYIKLTENSKLTKYWRKKKNMN